MKHETITIEKLKQLITTPSEPMNEFLKQHELYIDGDFIIYNIDKLAEIKMMLCDINDEIDHCDLSDPSTYCYRFNIVDDDDSFDNIASNLFQLIEYIEIHDMMTELFIHMHD